LSLFLLKEKVTKKFKDNPIAPRVFVRPAPPKHSAEQQNPQYQQAFMHSFRHVSCFCGIWNV